MCMSAPAPVIIAPPPPPPAAPAPVPSRVESTVNNTVLARENAGTGTRTSREQQDIQQAQAAQVRQRRAAAGSGTRASNIRTTALGLTSPASTAPRTILGV